jgi:ligand-binding sensor domain-containing protein/signal transduction histidine kinase
LPRPHVRVVAGLALLLASWLPAAEGPLTVPHQVRFVYFREFTTEEGLSQNTVRCILQDRRGFLWFGTDDGLNRFDGYRFRVIRNQPDIPAGLPHNRIRALFEDAAGGLWVGTMNGLYRLDRSSGRLVSVSLDGSRSGRADPAIHSFLESSREIGILWIGTSDGLYRLDTRTGKVQPFVSPLEDPDEPASREVNSLTETPDGRLWASAGGGVGWLDRTTGRFTRVESGPGHNGSLSSEAVTILACNRAGSLCLGSAAGLDLMDPRSGTIRQLHSAKLRSIAGVTALCTDSNGGLWIGTKAHGLARLTPDGTFVEYRYSVEQRPRESIGIVLSLYQDRNGNIWIGTNGGGVRRLNRHALNFSLIMASPEGSEGLPFDNVRTVLPDRRGRLWVGGFCGLSCCDRPGSAVLHFRPVAWIGPRSSGVCIHAITEDPRAKDTVLWIGTEGEGLWRYDTETGVAVSMLDAADPRRRLPAPSIFTMSWEADDVLWIGTSHGLFKYLRASRIFKPVKLEEPDRNEPAEINIEAVRVDRFRSVWVGTEDRGIFRLDQPPGEPPRIQHYSNHLDEPTSLSDNRINVLFEDRSGIFWVGTFGGGLNRFDRERDSFTRFTTHDGLPDNVIEGILEDSAGRLWVSSRSSLTCAKSIEDQPEFRNFGAPDGLPTNPFNDDACASSGDGRFFFGGLSGLTTFKPEAIRPDPLPPPVVLTGLRVFDRESELLESRSPGTPLVFRYGDSPVSFEFAALDFSATRRNQYAYRLEGLDSRWNYCDAAHRTATFHNLEPGDYVFQVRAANSDGVWNESGLSIPVVITPPLWRRGWFVGLSTLALLGLASIVPLYLIGRYRRKAADRLEMAQTLVDVSETERQRIGLELHDNLSHDLLDVAVQLRLLARSQPDREESLRSVEDKVKAAIQQTRRIARGVFPLALAANGLPAMLEEIQYMVEQDYQIPCEAHLDPAIRIEDLRVASHLYYIAREALLNAARHSGTDRLVLGLQAEGDSIVLRVRDFGVGLPAASTMPGLGLKIMEHRAQLIGATFSMGPAAGGGAEIVCRLELPPGGKVVHPTNE